MLNKIIGIIDKADDETLMQMAGYVFGRKYLEGILIASIKLMEKKEQEKFIEFFDNDKLDNHSVEEKEYLLKRYGND